MTDSMESVDLQLFRDISVPKRRDYHRLSNSPTRDQPLDDDYFEKMCQKPLIQCSTPAKMNMADVPLSENDIMLTINENFEEPAKSPDIVSDKESVITTIEVKPPGRAPLKIAPANETDNIEDLSRLALFAPKQPLRLTQRRRSERQQQEATGRSIPAPKTRSRTPSVSSRAAVGAHRSSSSVRSSSAVRAPPATSAVAPRSASVTRGVMAARRERTPSVARPAPQAISDGPVTRSKARIAAASGTPVTAAVTRPVVSSRRSDVEKLERKMGVMSIGGGHEPRNRAPRGNTTGTTAGRRSNSVTRPKPAPAVSSTNNTAARPMATIRRSNMHRLTNDGKPTSKPENAAVPQQTVQKPAVEQAKPKVDMAVRSRPAPLRIAPSPSKPVRKSGSTEIGARLPLTLAHRRSKVVPPAPARTNATPVRPPVAAEPKVAKTLRRSDMQSLVDRLSTPKNPTNRRSTVRESRKSVQVPNFVRSTSKSGCPTVGGTHGLRDTPKARKFTGSNRSLASNPVESKQ
ncbi:unnamed protein product [Caenorhabditis auriculariae]|uniref:Uncharacterized protein n=1 Tax=Caenorhabditis auriculariae TaxID=2777116 RepID=A0A8S1H819_9PELO|nr:unnamed protein product [Caenorhabditis auriculariae]